MIAAWLTANVGSLLAALLAAGVGVYTVRQNRAAAERAREDAKRAAERQAMLDEQKVDGEAFERAREFDREIVQGLRNELQRLSDQVAALRSELESERRAHGEERRKSTQLENKVTELEQTVSRLRRIVNAADLELPPELRG